MKGGYSAVIAAAGDSSRFGGGKLKQKVGGKAVLSHSLDVFLDDDDCGQVILVVNPAVREWIETNPLVFSGEKLTLVDGGPSRARSVQAGLALVTGYFVAIHDAGRPNFGSDLLGRLKATVQPGTGAVPGIPSADTLARVESAAGQQSAPADDFLGGAKKDQRTGKVTEYIDRAHLYQLQTPQLFERDSYLRSIAHVGPDLDAYTDDSSIYLAGGNEVSVVGGHPGNIKITFQSDLDILLKLMGGGEKKSKDRYGGLGW